MILIRGKYLLYFTGTFVLILVNTFNFIKPFGNSGSFYDFGSFLASGQLADQGKNPYSLDSPLVFSVEFSGSEIKGEAPNLNPPISVLFFQLFANLDPTYALWLWRIISIIFFIIAIILIINIYPLHGYEGFLKCVWAFSLAGFWHIIRLGQIYCLLLLLCVIAWILLRTKKTIAAGLFIGILIAIKPNFVVWAIFLLFMGYWKLFISAGFSALIISSIPLVTNGFIIYKQWLDAVSIFTPNLLPFVANNSFQGLFIRFGPANVGIWLSIVFFISIILFILKKKPPLEKVNALSIISSLFLSPIAWTGYTILTLPIYFEKKKWDWKYIFSAAIFTVPIVIPALYFTESTTNFILFGWFYGWGLLLLLLGIIFPELINNNKSVRYLI